MAKSQKKQTKAQAKQERESLDELKMFGDFGHDDVMPYLKENEQAACKKRGTIGREILKRWINYVRQPDDLETFEINGQTFKRFPKNSLPDEFRIYLKSFRHLHKRIDSDLGETLRAIERCKVQTGLRCIDDAHMKDPDQGGLVSLAYVNEGCWLLDEYQSWLDCVGPHQKPFSEVITGYADCIFVPMDTSAKVLDKAQGKDNGGRPRIYDDEKMRRIEALRGDGKTWREIAEIEEGSEGHAEALRKSYNRHIND